MRVLIKNYIMGLGSFLDEKGIHWESADDGTDEGIYIYFDTEEELFRLGFEFGRAYEEGITRTE